ncbi:MAG: hypothetical protein LBS05_02175, partial [Tannerellaceae bacterium]|nr:hypothetical protein [Tannerellaceae bacterium]
FGTELGDAVADNDFPDNRVSYIFSATGFFKPTFSFQVKRLSNCFICIFINLGAKVGVDFEEILKLFHNEKRSFKK